MPEEANDQTSPAQPDLEAALRRLGEHVDVPPEPEYGTLLRQRLEESPRPRTALSVLGRPRARIFVATAATLLVLAVVLGVPTSREAVADLFGISGVQVHPMPTTGPSPRTTIDASLELGEPVSLREAQRRVSFPVLVPTARGLGTPDAVYVRAAAGLQAVNLVYRPRPGFPAGYDNHVGLLLSEYAGTATPYFDKYVEAGVPLSQVSVAGQWPGIYFPGAQEVYVRDPSDRVRTEPARLSGPSLVWERGGVTYRLEANIGRERALAIAAALRPVN